MPRGAHLEVSHHLHLQVRGKSTSQYMCMGDFCTCPAFSFSVVQKPEQYFVCATWTM